MLALFSIVCAVALTAGIVYVLRKYQTQRLEDHAERTAPLPPLQLDSSANWSDDKPSPVPLSGLQPGAASARKAGRDWQERCRALKAAGAYEEALALCREAWPAWSACRQAAVIQRARIRDARKQRRDISGLLADLYLIAARASFLHDGSTDLSSAEERNPRQRSPAQCSIEWVEALEMPYREIGYRQLRLLNKGDIRLLQAQWGEPRTHRSARAYHQA